MSATDMSGNDSTRAPEETPRPTARIVNTDAPPLNETLRDRIKRGRVQYQAGQTTEIPIPGWEYLVGVFRAIDDHEEYSELMDRVGQAVTSEREVPLYLMSEQLIAANVKIIARIDGEDTVLTQEGLPIRLGLGLLNYLELDSAADNDRQALFEIFPTTRSIVETGAVLEAFTRRAGFVSDRRLQGN